jgi:colicin import membrane protein
MNAALPFNGDPLLPRQPGGLTPSAVLALLCHAALIGALTLGVQWRTQPVAVVAAELWSAVPRTAAPPEATVEPPPAPPAPVQKAEPTPALPPKAAVPDAQIAIERQRKEREAQKQAALDEAKERNQRERQAAEAKAAQNKLAQAKAAEAKAAQQREENLKRMLGQAGSGATTGSASSDAAPSRAYAARLVAHIKPNIVFTDSVSGNPNAEVEVRVAPSGTIIARRLQKSSGVKEWDEAVLRAIDRTGTLPRDTDGRVPPVLIIGFRPND